MVEAMAAFDTGQCAGKAGDDLAAVAAGSPPSHPAAFQQHDLAPPLRQMQSRGQARIAAADDTHIGHILTGQRGMAGVPVGRCRIV